MKRLSERETVRLLLFLTEQAHDLTDQQSDLAAERSKTLADIAARSASIRADRHATSEARRETVLSLVQDHGWSQVRVARLLGVSVPRVFYIINGRHQNRNS